jgi:hypothetical protein
MIVAERENLIPVKVLISNSFVHLELFENREGNLFLSSSTSKPEGTVYYGTTASLFCKFLENKIDLQTMFNKTPSHFVQISTKDKTALYTLKNISVELKCGDKTIKQLTSNCPIEIW